MIALVAAVLALLATDAAGQGAPVPCLTLSPGPRWSADRASTVTLTPEGRARVPKGATAALLVTGQQTRAAPADRQMVRRIPDRGVRLRFDPGSYTATLAVLRSNGASFSGEPVGGCAPQALDVAEASGPWTPNPQAWLTAGGLFLETGVEGIELLGKWGLAASVTYRTSNDPRRWVGAVVARRSATRGYFDLGVRQGPNGDWDRPLLGVGLEMPPYRGHPFWITVSMALPNASRDIEQWRPGQWYQRENYDLLFGLRFDLRRVTR